MSETLELTKALIAKPSITPEDAGCQTLIAQELRALGFYIEFFEINGVTNLWATKGNKGPVFCFAGHTDVVPPGDLTHWSSPPFEPTIRDGYLYGRGAVDMKSGIASMVIATKQFLKNNRLSGTLAFLITSDEEGPSIHGTQAVLQRLKARHQAIDYCLVGEPSCMEILGDTIKQGRRGSIHGHLSIFGKQGHVAYPEKVKNPMHIAFEPLSALSNHIWDQGNEAFPPTSFQFTQLSSGFAKNVVPETLTADFNLRFSSELTAETIQETTEQILKSFNLKYQLDWIISGHPFLTKPGKLLSAVEKAIHSVVKINPSFSTAGGTSDGRFFAHYGAQVVEFGHCNRTLHEINECIEIEQLDKLTDIYFQLLVELNCIKYTHNR
ncbi:MAG: succinyl-diaminopimelate desuccinylase [Gammaproteobacteria bacterium]